MPQQRLKIPRASTKTQHSQINKYFFKNPKIIIPKKKSQGRKKDISQRALFGLLIGSLVSIPKN